MGADTFEVLAKGKTAREAFNKTVKKAQYDFGHNGYTGTIAEKDDFEMVKLLEGADLDIFIENQMDDKFSDKWGPAGCIEKSPGVFIFFGWASS